MKLNGREERIAALKKHLEENPLPERQPETLTFQLGYYIGEYLVRNYMLNLSIDYPLGRNIVKVSQEDTERYEAVQKLLNNRENRNYGEDRKPYAESDEWKNYIAVRKELHAKYLSEFLECHVGRIESVTDYEELKRGIGVAMWDSDISCYECDPGNIQIKEDGRCTVITLKRGS